MVYTETDLNKGLEAALAYPPSHTLGCGIGKSPLDSINMSRSSHSFLDVFSVLARVRVFVVGSHFACHVLASLAPSIPVPVVS